MRMIRKFGLTMALMSGSMMAWASAPGMPGGLGAGPGPAEGAGAPQVKDDLFAGTEKFAKGASDVTNVDLGPDMLGMVGGKRSASLAHKMNFMVVHTFSYPKPGMYNMADVDAYRQKLKDGSWNCFIHTYESKTGESTDICSRPTRNHEGNEMVIMTVEPKELTFIHMSGNASLADLSKLGNMVPPAPPAPPAPPEPQLNKHQPE